MSYLTSTRQESLLHGKEQLLMVPVEVVQSFLLLLLLSLMVVTRFKRLSIGQSHY